MGHLFWLSDEAWAAIEPHLPTNQPGARRVDDRRVISGILHVLKSGCRWRDCPSATVRAPPSTIASIAGLAGASGSAFCKPLSRPAGSRPRHRSMQPMSRRTAPPMAVKGGEDAGHRSFAWRSDHKDPCPDGCFGASSGHSAHPGNVSDIRVADDLIEAAGPVRRLIADRGYDANRLRHTLRSTGTIPVIPGRRSRRCPIRHDVRRYRDRWRIEAAFCRLKDFRRVATRYDKLAVNFLSAVILATIIAFWV